MKQGGKYHVGSIRRVVPIQMISGEVVGRVISTVVEKTRRFVLDPSAPVGMTMTRKHAYLTNKGRDPK